MLVIQSYFKKIKYIFMKSFEFNKIDESGIILDINNLSKIIKNELHKISCKNISFAIQNENIINRNIKILNTTIDKDIIGLIKYELSNYMPININDYTLKYRVIDKKEKYLDVQVILMPKLIIKNYKDLASLLKLKPKNLSVNFDILNNLMANETIKLEGKKSLILDIGNIYTNVNFIEYNFIKNSYTLNNKYIYEFLENKISKNNRIYYYGVEDKEMLNLLDDNFNLNKINIKNDINLTRYINNIGVF